MAKLQKGQAEMVCSRYLFMCNEMFCWLYEKYFSDGHFSYIVRVIT